MIIEYTKCKEISEWKQTSWGIAVERITNPEMKEKNETTGSAMSTKRVESVKKVSVVSNKPKRQEY